MLRLVDGNDQHLARCNLFSKDAPSRERLTLATTSYKETKDAGESSNYEEASYEETRGAGETGISEDDGSREATRCAVHPPDDKVPDGRDMAI